LRIKYTKNNNGKEMKDRKRERENGKRKMKKGKIKEE
jgi:hypothetical protein